MTECCSGRQDNDNDCRVYARRKDHGKFFSLHHHDIARWLFITLTFAGLPSTGWFGIPLVPQYFVDDEIDIIAAIFTLLSALGTIWGIMAYRELTRSASVVIEARLAARRLDAMIGDYEYRSYNPITREYENGFVPSGPIDFWDKETQVPSWMDKGKYWHILLGLRSGNKETKLQVVRDRDLPFYGGRGKVAATIREKVVGEGTKAKRYRYAVRIPQWLVMNTERKRFADQDLTDAPLSALITDLNLKIVAATDEVAEWERQRIRYPWKITTLGAYLNKSLPLRPVYRQVVRSFPGAKKRIVEETNANLANIRDDDLVASLVELASQKGIPTSRIEMIQLLLRFLKNAYASQGLGEGASEYHSFHHSLEVSYMALHMLPSEYQHMRFGPQVHSFGPKDYEMILVGALLHDYDPDQVVASLNLPGKSKIKGPSVVRTVEELARTRILDAYFTMNRTEFENYFREFKSALAPPSEFATTHPEYVKAEWSPAESVVVEALIWRTDFPYFKQKLAQERFGRLLLELTGRGGKADRLNLLGEILWLADLAVTYMGSDPIRAWDRVINLYDELYLPKLEAVSRTDAFFTDFADDEVFNEIINLKQFPFIFRQRWKLVYDFFHEGNPSTQLNNTIENARKMFSRVNLEIEMRKGDLLQAAATENWSEYFIGVGKDQNEVVKAKSRFADLDPQNASAFWGDAHKLLPAIKPRSIDNFLMVLPEDSTSLATTEDRASFGTLFKVLSKKLVHGGMLRILTDLEKDSAAFRELVHLAGQAGFQPTGKPDKAYFPRDWRDPEFRKGSAPQVVVLAIK